MKKFVCPMHPDITSDKPGTCSKCHMDLVEVGIRQKKHDHTKMMASPEAATDFLRRFVAVTVLLVPLFVFNKIYPSRYIEFGIATVIFLFGLVFFKHAKMEISMRKYGMMTLVSLGIGAGYLFSAFSTFIPALNSSFYLEIATLIWVLLFGHYLEARSSSSAGNALSEVVKLLPKKAHLKTKGDINDVDISILKVGDIVLVKPGEKVPADGKIVSGEANFNEAHITGESKPVNKKTGSEVLAGAICAGGMVEVRLTKVGEASTVGQIKNLIEKAQATKPNAQKLADRAASWLTFSAITVSVIAFFVWWVVLGQPLSFSITLAITVLVIACPHALGLAIPTVSTISTRLAVANGLFIKDMGKIEVVKDVTYVVFDKTGTLTRGNFVVADFTNLETLKFAAAVEKFSEHPIAAAIVSEARKRKIQIPKANKFKSTAGHGVLGYVNGDKIEVKKPGVSVYKNEKLIGVVEVSDMVRPESKEVIDQLHKMGIKSALISGDKKEVVERVGKELGIDTIYSEVAPVDKYKYIKKLQDDGNVVAMAGDGVNDAPALTQANVGVAIGAGTDVAVEAGDVVLTQSSPESLVKLIILSKKVYKKMVENLIYAAGYNVIAIPVAAGVLIPFGFRLTPAIGAFVMSLSSVAVVANALTLLHLDLNTN